MNGADQARIGAGDPGNRCVAHAVQGAARAAGIKSALCERDGFEPVAAEQIDRRDWSDRYGGQLTGQVLVDRDGIVRWANIEGERDGLAGLERFPTDEEFLAVARRLVA